MTPTLATSSFLRFANFRTRKSTPFAPSPTHHSILMTHYSRPMSIFALFTQKRGFPPCVSPPPTHHSLLVTHHTFPMSTLSIFALFAQKRGSSGAGGIPNPHPNGPARKAEKNRSIFPFFAQNHCFLPPRPAPANVPPTQHSLLRTHHFISHEHLRIIPSKTRFPHPRPNPSCRIYDAPTQSLRGPSTRFTTPALPRTL